MPLLRRSPRRTVAIALATAALVAGGGAAGAVAVTVATQPAIRTTTPKHASDVTNVDVLRQQIANYYGDPLKTGTIGKHSNYVKELHGIERNAASYLAHAHHAKGKKKAILLDVDDTALATWNYETSSNWAYDPTTNAEYVTDERFPAVPGMVRLVKAAKAHGYAVFFLTGRPAAQEAATLGNLTDSDTIGLDAGYPTPTDPDGTGPEDGLYTKPPLGSPTPWLASTCGTTVACTTVQYKSLTRKHIESLGYDIVANFGDQYSDLKGGSADKGFKLPNPNYYLP
ncbi:HAD family acid phosphatase [Amnibacterium kyonggiense]|uniref:Putative acid phosphatase of HAD superfamily subfamily IIIB n=1 Tax=Amnibacterium kyonggiense TaxID=595671 RepID=A0A4R7FSA1_9MICO|nr:HAD family acid phosphatase [Amnibacterium kyonggiense]TDS80700.1 putative acid phosphatase of HAD superfamily subfamily IIIB [Amnibacterium kyonggiense]